MSSWGNNDNAANAPYWAVNSTIVHTPDVSTNFAKASAANVALLYANTTANVYITGETIGLFAIDAQEIAAQGHGIGAHAGWNLRTTGSGGRAGRIQTETLVALANVIGDGDQQVYPNVSITITGPSNASIFSEASYANVATFSISTALSGNTSSTLTYQWQYDNSGAWANIPANTVPIHWYGSTGTTLYAMPKTTANNNTKLRIVVTAADEGVVAYSANAVLSIPA